MMWFRLILLAIASFMLRLAVSTTPEEQEQEFLLQHRQNRTNDGLAPLYGTDDDDRIQTEYIVLFEPGYTLREHFQWIGTDLSNATGFLSFGGGYGAELDNLTLNSLVRMDPCVLLVETNHHIESPQPIESLTRDVAAAEDQINKQKYKQNQKRGFIHSVEEDAPYNLQMLSAAGKLSTPVSDHGEHHFFWRQGEGVNVYVLDGGIRTSHMLFGGRANHFGGAASEDMSNYVDEINDDLDGHGTHVAGIIGAEKYGVAPFANIINVKVLGEGQNSARINQALQDVTAEHLANKARDPPGSPWKFRGSIINMSLIYLQYDNALQWYLIQANKAGIAVFAAAGNWRVNARVIWPCAFEQVMCVGAVDSTYTFTRYSDYGNVLNFLAPGTNILSLGIETDHGLAFRTGTSMACPHAAGAAAIFVHWQGLVNNQVGKYVQQNSLSGITSHVPWGTVSNLINTGIQSPKKFEDEPFRWAGEYPVRNHDINVFLEDVNSLNTSIDPSSVATGVPLTGVDVSAYTTMQTTTVSDPTGLTTEAGTITWDPILTEATSSISVPTQTEIHLPPGGTPGQQIGLASLIDPYDDPDAWKRLIDYDSSKVSVLIADILNPGTDSQVDIGWKSLIDRVNSTGKRVIGYVGTGYLGTGEQALSTRLGSPDLADWVSQIESDVDEWYRLYGTGIGGIFFDEGSIDCGPDNMYSDLYAYINTYTKRRYPGAFTVLHSGSNTSQCFENTMDTLLTFTDSYETYNSSYTALDWKPADPRKIWHVIDSVPAEAISTVVALARDRGAGLVEVTNDTPDKPYDNLPDDAYMQSFMNAVQGGSAPVTDAPVAASGPAADIPGNLTVTSFGYSFVSLSWEESANLNAMGYNVYINEWQALSLPFYMTRVTVGGIAPGTSGLSFTVKAIGGGNVESESSNSVIASTLSLPDGKPIINARADPQDGFTTYSADVLPAYSSLRLYITYSNSKGECDYQNRPAWPIYYNPSSGYCAVAMVLSGKLYRYNGTITDRKHIPWAWTPAGSVPITRTGYSFSWVAPIGSSTLDTTSFVIHVQGHGPPPSVFSPCPKSGERPDNGIFCA